MSVLLTASRRLEVATPGEAAPREGGQSLSRHVLKNSVFILIARGVQMLSAFLVAVAVARYLSITQFGEYSFLLAFVSSVMALAYFGIQQILVREIAKGEAPAGQILGAAVKLRTLLSLVAAAIIVVSLSFMNLPALLVKAGLIAVLSEFCLSFSMLSKAMFQAFEKMIYEPVVSLLYSVALLAGVAAVILFDLGFLWLFAAIALANLAQLAAATAILSRKFVRPVMTVERGMYLRFFKDSLVIGVGVFFYQNLFKINVLMLRWVGSVDDVAFFSVPHSLIVQLQIIPLSLSLAIFPVFSRLIVSDRERMTAIYEKIFRVMFVASAFAAAMLSLYAREIITLMFSSKFEQSISALTVVAWAMVPLTMDMLLNGVLIAMNKQRYSVIYAGATIVLNFFASLLFIPRYGFMAAAYIAVSSYALLFLCSQFVIVRNGVAIKTARTVASTLLAAAAGALAVILVKPYSLIVSLLLGPCAFGLVVLATGAITARELMQLRESLRSARRVSPT